MIFQHPPTGLLWWLLFWETSKSFKVAKVVGDLLEGAGRTIFCCVIQLYIYIYKRKFGRLLVGHRVDEMRI